MKKFLAIVLVVVLSLSLCGCDLLKDIVDSTKSEKAKTFDFEGISIELTTSYLRMEFISEEYDFIVGNETVSVFGIKIPFNENGLEALSVSEYAQNFHDAMQDENPTDVTLIDSIPSLQYTSVNEDGEEQTAAVMFYKGTDCFWVICFVTESEDFSDSYEDICKFAKSVKCE